MRRYDENELEFFIRNNKDKFNENSPNETHEVKFLSRLNARIKHYISIVPHLIKVAIATLIIFTVSIIIWNNYIRKDRHEITLKQKIVNVFTTATGKR